MIKSIVLISLKTSGIDLVCCTRSSLCAIY